MSYKVTTNPDQSEGNTFMLPVTNSGQPGTGEKKLNSIFFAKFDTGTVDSVDRMVIDGTTHTFTACDPATEAGRAALELAVDTLVTSLIGVNNGKTRVHVNGTTIIVRTPLSEIKFQQIGKSGTLAVFVPIHAEMEGVDDSTDAGFEIHVLGLNEAEDAYVVQVKPVAGKTISAFTVNYGGGAAEYNSSWPKPSSYSLPSGTTIVNGAIQFEVATATAEAAGTLVVSVTATGGTIVTYSQSVVLSNYTGH